MSGTTAAGPRVVLVTGASTGFGRLTVEALARRGHQVFAALRDVGGRNKQAATELTNLASAEAVDLQVVELDVTDQESADQAISAVIRAVGRIDVIVNNAGVIFPGPVEAFSAEEAARQFDVNVLGPLRVNRAALPCLREQGRGALVQIGSVSGRVTVPFSGLYAASKAALASLTEAWHYELAPFGVESVLIEAASYETSIGANAVMPADMARLGIYMDGFDGFVAAITARASERGSDTDPRVVSDAIVGLVEAPDGKRPLRTIIAPAGQDEALHAFGRTAAETTQTVARDMGVISLMTR